MRKKMLWWVAIVLIPMLGADVPGENAPSGKLKSVTEWVTEEDNGKNITYKDEYEEFDRHGNRLSYINYKKDGTISEKENIAYDKFGNRVEVIRYEMKKSQPAGDSYDRKTYKYNSFKQKTEECDYNRAGEIKTRTRYSYNNQGKKFQEEVFDGKGKLKKKVVITFDARQHPVQKVTTNEKGETTKLQKYTYEYF